MCAYNCDKDKVEFSVKNNKYDAGSALNYLLVRKLRDMRAGERIPGLVFQQ